MPSSPTTVFIAAISSDIGQSMARLYRARGYNVIGTYRDPAHLGNLSTDDGIELLPCDVAKPEEIDSVAKRLVARGLQWDIFIGAVGQLSPIGPFFDVDREEWKKSATLNGNGQLELLHSIYPQRRARPLVRIALLVGGAINRAFANYSAYSLGKINLVKFCELIHEEYHDVHAVALGTGWVATKIHHQTEAAAERAGENLRRTREFMASGQSGTSVPDIVSCIDWCFAQDREVTGGRNFSVVHDPWRDGGAELTRALRRDTEKFKLRRHANLTNAKPLSS